MLFIRRYIIVLLLGITLIVSSIAYIFIPDNTIDANNMHPELRLKKPGFTIRFLDTLFTAKPSGNMFNGYSRVTSQIPVSKIFETNHNITAIVYNGTSMPYDTLTLSMSHIHLTNITYFLGTDVYGRDLFSRLILGMRNSLIIGFVAVLVSIFIGVFLGVTAGYFRGYWENIVMWFINVIWSLPTLLIVFGLTIALGKGFWQVFLAIGLTLWVETARVVRAETLSISNRDFVTASYVLGRNNLSIILKHIIPNIWPIIWVLAANNFAGAMLLESGLSFLGLGVQPPSPTLGSLLRENYGFIVTSHAYLAFIPGVTLMILVLMFYQTGVSLKNIFNKIEYS